MTMKLFFSMLLLFLSCSRAQMDGDQDAEQVEVDADLERVFNESPMDGLQRRYTIDLLPKSQECFYIDNVQQEHVLHVHYMVVNVGKNGRPLDITMTLKDPDKRIVTYHARRTEGKLIDHHKLKDGDYELCFNNKYSLFETKRVVWQFEVEGASDETRELKMAVQHTVEEYEENAKVVKAAIRKVKSRVSSMRHAQWRVESLMRKDSMRVESIRAMIDRWSVIYVCMVVALGIGQAFLLKRFFNQPVGPHHIQSRT